MHVFFFSLEKTVLILLFHQALHSMKIFSIVKKNIKIFDHFSKGFVSKNIQYLLQSLTCN